MHPLNGATKCEAEDQGGHPCCDLPATLQTKALVGGERQYYCHRHKTNRHVWSEDELMPMVPTVGTIQALAAWGDEQEAQRNAEATEWYRETRELAEALGVPQPFHRAMLARARELAAREEELKQQLKHFEYAARDCKTRLQILGYSGFALNAEALAWLEAEARRTGR